LFKVILPDGQETVPVEMQTLMQWAAEGRIHSETVIVDTDSLYRFRAGEHPHLRGHVVAAPVLTGTVFEPAPLTADPVNPWIAMLTRPRQTIRQIVSTDPTYAVILLTAIGGIGSINADSLNRLQSTMPLGFAIALLLALIPAFMVLFLYVSAALIRWVGSWFGGEANAQEVRAAIAWGNLPSLYLLPMVIAQTIIGVTVGAAEGSPLYAVVQVLSFIEWVGIFWSLIVMMKAIGEVHGFSAWKAFGVSFLAWALIVVPLLVVVILLATLL
jgi:hypothetical protein